MWNRGRIDTMLYRSLEAERLSVINSLYYYCFWFAQILCQSIWLLLLLLFLFRVVPEPKIHSTHLVRVLGHVHKYVRHTKSIFSVLPVGSHTHPPTHPQMYLSENENVFP